MSRFDYLSRNGLSQAPTLFVVSVAILLRKAWRIADEYLWVMKKISRDIHWLSALMAVGSVSENANRNTSKDRDFILIGKNRSY